MNDPTQPVQLGNLYAIAAAVAAAMVTPGRAEPLGVLVQRDGTITAHAADIVLMGNPGFVGWVSEDTDPQRFAQRLAAAHAKVVAS
ncbi:hypothetical protein LJB71_08250 [Thermomonas sp. S9]|uniref:hypothetical protein n=1 Tax=Thermomonas sp. S9 TaxID=2885203 RepID=UPI00216ABB87|nr:hypothetical protein [Thermomonas sp. S9]MCR6496206.1 hypothetical protein [Thermomonas sp. S9]